MTDESCVAIKNVREIPLFGEESIETRLRKVGLRGFPHVKIYSEAKIELIHFSPKQIERKLHTPQPSIYQPNLDRIASLHRLFLDEGIDILKLDRGYDFIAVSDKGVETMWTMIPPVVERFFIPNKDGRLGYEDLVSAELMERLHQEGLGLNEEVMKMPHTSRTEMFDLINDGAHRIHFGYLNGGVKVLRISGMTPGFPYYAAPQPYATQIHPFVTKETTDMKKHIAQEPGQKMLYRLFPSGGILSGEVRPAVSGEKFL